MSDCLDRNLVALLFTAVADLHTKVSSGPQTGPNYFVFTNIFAKEYPRRKLAAPTGKSWIRPALLQHFSVIGVRIVVIRV